MNRFIKTMFLLMAAGCQSADYDQHSNAISAKEMFEAFNRHDWKTMAAYYAEPASFLDPSFGIEYVNKSRLETVEKYSEMEKMFPDIQDSIVGLYPSGDKVTIEFISTGTARDSTRFTLPIITVLTFSHGRIVKDATYYDNP